MIFRIQHLLVATALMAFFAMGLTNPSPHLEVGLVFFAWLSAVLLIARAIKAAAKGSSSHVA